MAAESSARRKDMGKEDGVNAVWRVCSIKKSLMLRERAAKARSPQQSEPAEIAPSIIITPDGQSGVERRREGPLPLTRRSRRERGGPGTEPK
ncbi:hypothetical protein SKAU_G00349330 [Synaphobranchus kaupii]|uniref:Uncharacterized protein n=1 Tax=Synaphobranchus kaupii TaxID=118154 RepID=A0A9Q1EKC1_SYNKA|nr:hypothetical protein SKAU_G00349330 [Synaphobranchus kaupii]